MDNLSQDIAKFVDQKLRDYHSHPSQISRDVAASYGIPIDPGDPNNNPEDAFRHAYASAVATYLLGASPARAFGDWNEDRLANNPPLERNMDLWNNSIGRNIGATAQSLDEIGGLVAAAYFNGSLISTIPDPQQRQYVDPPPSSPADYLADLTQSRLGPNIILFLFGGNPLMGGGLLGAGAILNLRQYFTSASTILTPLDSPLILDLDGDGVETTALNAGAYVDHDANGFAEQTGWVGPDDGILVRDLNGNGTIDDGRELFGNNTRLSDQTLAAHGYQALADLDSNADGTIDFNDPAFTQLLIWQDTDGDGISIVDELHTLSDLNIASINTNYTTSSYVDPNGNEHRQVSTFTRTDSTTGATADVWFQSDKAFTVATDWLDVPSEIAALPDAQGFGNVYDLHQAMVRDTSGTLTSLVQSFVNETDPAARSTLLDQLLFTWTGSAGLDPASRGGQIDARQLATF